MAPNLMELVRELKALNARKKTGETLAPHDEARRKELKGFLRNALEASGSAEGGATSTEGRATASAPPSVPAPIAAAPLPRATTPAPVPRAPLPAPAPLAPAPLAPAPVGLSVAEAPFVAPVPAEVPKYKNQFVIDADIAGALIDTAMKSDAVARVDPFALRHAHASTAELDESVARADLALRANKKRPAARTHGEIALQLKDTDVSYTPSENPLTLEQYYGGYADDGFVAVRADEAGGLRVVDAAEAEVQKINFAALGVVPAGLMFLDDFVQLYAARLFSAVEADSANDSDDPSLLIAGKRKVTVLLINGEKRQGMVRVLRRGDASFRLEPLGSGQADDVAIAQCRAVFVHASAGARAKDPSGASMLVTLRDGRTAQGASDDYQAGAPTFSLVPSGRGQFERVIINAAYVQTVS